MIHIQNSFVGGMNLLSNETQLDDVSYRFLINARQRIGYIEPNKENLLIDAPAGKKQGHIGVGSAHVIFVAGLAYYRLDGQVGWSLIPGFSMDPVVDRYYTQSVPASTFNFRRKKDPLSANRPILVDANVAINGIPAGILVQDNVNQPQVIEFNNTTGTFTAFVTSNYSEWSTSNSEYVPIGRQMMHKNGITFVVARDGKSIFRSVSGRPLDFMVNVDVNGNKLPSELNGGASSTSFAFDFDEITSLIDSNAEDTFLLATKNHIRIIKFDYDNTIFGEPRFRELAIIKAGVVNQESMIEVLGDFAFVDFETISTFNAVLQLRNEGRTSIFSLQLSSLLKNIKQREPCACVFDSFALFYVKTTYGNLIVVYDMLHQKWVALDLTTVDRIKQFAFVETTTETKLYAITHHDELFQMYGSTERALAQLKTRAFVPFADLEHKGQVIKPVFKGGTIDGNLTVIEYVDEIQSSRLTSELEEASSGINYPVIPPVIPNNIPTMKNNSVVLKDGYTGKKLEYILQWNTDAKLYGFTLTTSEILKDASIKQQAKTLQETYST